MLFLPAKCSLLFSDRFSRVSKNYCFHYKYSLPALKRYDLMQGTVSDRLKEWLPTVSSGVKFNPRVSQHNDCCHYHEGLCCWLMLVHYAVAVGNDTQRCPCHKNQFHLEGKNKKVKHELPSPAGINLLLHASSEKPSCEFLNSHSLKQQLV